MTYPNALSLAFSQEHDRRLMQIVYEAVQDGLIPWEPGRIAIFIDENLGGKFLAIKLERFPELIFRTKPDYFLREPTQMVMSIAEKAFNFYRYRVGLPVEDHIILGEE